MYDGRAASTPRRAIRLEKLGTTWTTRSTSAARTLCTVKQDASPLTARAGAAPCLCGRERRTLSVAAPPTARILPTDCVVLGGAPRTRAARRISGAAVVSMLVGTSFRRLCRFFVRGEDSCS